MKYIIRRKTQCKVLFHCATAFLNTDKTAKVEASNVHGLGSYS